MPGLGFLLNFFVFERYYLKELFSEEENFSA